jgi:putative N6-adenine-specific DNA methylase
LGNPPYGERLGDQQQALDLYRRMAVLFNHFSGWQAGFITAHPGFEDALGRRAADRKKITGGNLNACFYLFERARENPPG